MAVGDSNLIRDLFEINRQVSLNLWRMTHFAGTVTGSSPRLIFPAKGGQRRISEQEAKILCCNLLSGLSYYYSVETPTREKYQQRGDSPTRARSDISLYALESGQLLKVANMEFKAHKSKYPEIRKDVEKLIRERLCGNWFHTLRDLHGSTRQDLFRFFKASFLDFEGNSHTSTSILFCLCLLRERRAYMRHFDYCSEAADYERYVRDFFEPNDVDERWQQFSEELTTHESKEQKMEQRDSQLSDEERWELAQSMRLKPGISCEQARDVLLGIGHAAFTEALDAHWKCKGGNVTVESKCWFFCWAKTGTNSVDTASACQEAWDRIFDKSYEWFDRNVGHDFGRGHRYGGPRRDLL